MKSQPILTIGIPTFNRIGPLIRTLGELGRQIEALPEVGIELVISDNCSTDNTEDIVNQWIRERPSLAVKYVRNSRNIGFDANCHNLFLHASGKLVWILADDDFLQPIAVATICQVLEKSKNVHFVFVNYSVSVNGVLAPPACRCQKTVEIPGSDIFVMSRFAFSFISSCIIRRDSWLAANPEQYFGTDWIHMFVVRDIMNDGRAIVIAEPLITMNGLDIRQSRMEKRMANTGVDFYVAAHMKFVKYAYSLQHYGYSLKVSKFARQAAWGDNFRQIVYYKATAPSYDYGELRNIAGSMIKYFWIKPFFWIFQLPLLALPSSLTSSLYWKIRPIYKKAKTRLNLFRQQHSG